jgi:hypothetical protein
MSPDPTSLQNLRDLAVPSPVSWWPLAPGWYILIALLLAATLTLALRAWRSHRQNAYRRAALHELNTASSPQQIAALLKRTALAAYPRSQVASLSGPAWTQWLTQSTPIPLPPEVATQLTQSIFTNTPSENTTQLRTFTKSWITHHPNVNS